MWNIWQKTESLSSETFVCSRCDKRFTRKDSLSRHIQQIHAGQFKFYCDRCKKGFQTVTPYNEHIARHEGIRYHCEDCFKIFYSKPALQKHRVVHAWSKNASLLHTVVWSSKSKTSTLCLRRNWRTILFRLFRVFERKKDFLVEPILSAVLRVFLRFNFILWLIVTFGWNSGPFFVLFLSRTFMYRSNIVQIWDIFNFHPVSLPVSFWWIKKRHFHWQKFVLLRLLFLASLRIPQLQRHRNSKR